MAILIAAFGLAATVPALSPVFAPAAQAQAVSSQVEQNQLQAQIIALAQAGQTDQIKDLVALKIRQGKAGMVATVVKAIATMGANLAGVDPTNAATLVNIAVVLAADPAVSGADSTVESVVGDQAKAAVVTLQTSTNPNAIAASASIQTNVANNGSSSTQQTYVASTGGTTQNTGSTQTTTNQNQQGNTVVVVNGNNNNVTVDPVIVIENPDQSSPT
ncbi:MAG: hypothetical protein EP335_15755 [Alphaproteobacteria bacterium]|nr:MAG: hypothetical protein EP335_15755 [Alphaproteobacteria bacterium]